MKLERVLRKAVPFLLIAILIACLFSKPQREGFKGFTKVHSEKSFDRDSKDWLKDNAMPLGVSAGVGTVVGGGAYHINKNWSFYGSYLDSIRNGFTHDESLRHANVIYDLDQARQRPTDSSYFQGARENSMFMTDSMRSSAADTVPVFNKIARYSSYADDLDHVD
jgi:hypothetical protein